MITPICLSAADARKLPTLTELVDAAHVLFELDRIEAVAASVRRSHEHAYSLTEEHAQDVLRALSTFDRYGASAFDEGTVQDLKHHVKADEIYLALRGSFRILWKTKGAAPFTSNNILSVSAGALPWAFIPVGHCLLVTRDHAKSFLAVAFKTEESNIRNGGKRLGKLCEYHKNQTCPHREDCETLNANRAGFFTAIQDARDTATNRANDVAGGWGKQL